jgi:hypothetical protein
LRAVLYLPQPFIPIFRVRQVLPKRLAQCECFDIEEQRFVTYTLEWDAICSDDPPEILRVLLNPAGYQPTTEELRWWIDENRGRLSRVP